MTQLEMLHYEVRQLRNGVGLMLLANLVAIAAAVISLAACADRPVAPQPAAIPAAQTLTVHCPLPRKTDLPIVTSGTPERN